MSFSIECSPMTHAQLLSSPRPEQNVAAKVSIDHVQLRDLIVCPAEAGVVQYASRLSIEEYDMNKGEKSTIAHLEYTPCALSSVDLPSASLIAAGGSRGEVHLTMRRAGSRESLWRFDAKLEPDPLSPSAINNSITFMKPDGRVDPYMVISTNDNAVLFYDVPTRKETVPDHMNLAGIVKFDVPINHSSISPDGRTLLSVGDSQKLHLHSIYANSSRVTLEHINTLSIPISGGSPASFASAFSPDGSKFAVAGQDGLVLAFDIRSTRPIWTHNTKKRDHGRSQLYSDWIIWDQSVFYSNMPPWGVRTLKFSPPGHRGHQTMMFAEHTSFVHIVDARTFAYQECVEMPQPPPQTAPAPSSSPRHSAAPEIDNSNVTARASITIQRQVERGFHAFNNHALRNRPPRLGHLVARRSSYYRPPLTIHRDGRDVTVIDEEPTRLRSIPDIGTSIVDLDIPMPVVSHDPATHDDEHDDDDEEEEEGYQMHPHYLDGIHDDQDNYVVDAYDGQHSPRQESSDWLHIAGVCYDPTGTYIYASGLNNIASWKIHGSDRRWWGASEWL